MLRPALPLYMDAVITPNRSLSKRGLWVLLGILAAYNLLLAAFLLAIGAFPVPIFLGLDFAGVALAFHLSNRRALNAERVQVSAERVEVKREAKGRPLTIWSSPTVFTRVSLERDGSHSRLELQLSGKRVAIGRALSPRERSALAQALQRAISTARGERHAPRFDATP